MLSKSKPFRKVYIACGRTDLRNGINGLATKIKFEYNLDPFDEGTLFIFCGIKTNCIKGLLWEGDGFLMLVKRLENGRYQWPRSSNELKEMTPEQYDLLISGFTIEPTINKATCKEII